MRILVTGASGYVGRAVVRGLLAEGHRTRLLCHTTRVAAPAGAEITFGDVLDPAGLTRAVAGVDAVVHLAAIAGVRRSFAQRDRFEELNVGGTRNLIEALTVAAPRGGEPPRLVFASSASVYGSPARQPIDETVPPDPASPYATSKLAAERAIVDAARAGRLGACTLRIFNAAGAVDGHGDPDDSRIIPKAVAVAAGRLSTMELYGDGSAVRDFVHIKDIATAFRAALAHCRPGRHDVFNVGATPASMNGVIDAVRRITGRDVPLVRRPANPCEVREVRADSARLRDVLGWHAAHSALDDMVADQWAAERAGRGRHAG